MKNQDGFSAVEAVLLLVIAAIIGLTGWYVWSNRAKTSNDKSTSTATPAKQTTAKKPDPYTGWKSEKGNLFTFKYPADWFSHNSCSLETVNAHDCFNVGPISTEEYSKTLGTAKYMRRLMLWQLLDTFSSDEAKVTGENLGNITVNGTSYTLIGELAKTTQMSAIQTIWVAKCQAGVCNIALPIKGGGSLRFAILPVSENIMDSSLFTPIDMSDKTTKSDLENIKLILASMEY
jgi:hypothetical protein